MPRTPAQITAAERDLERVGPWCVYHLCKHKMRVPASQVHHIARRGVGRDVDELCISLCEGCHTAHHNHSGSPSTSELLDIMLEAYNLDLRAMYPGLFGGK